jgi:hypothetical protein
MTSIPEDELRDIDRFLPVKKVGGTYVEISDETSLSEDDLSLWSLGGYISSNCERLHAEVDLRGRRYNAAVFIDRREAGRGFVGIDSEGSPCGAGAVLNALAVNVPGVSKEHLEVSEAVFLARPIDLPAQFVRPRFRMLETGQASGRLYSWEKLKDFSRVAIVGGPGSGRTTCLPYELWSPDTAVMVLSHVAFESLREQSRRHFVVC